jgi:hypothetical protein
MPTILRIGSYRFYFYSHEQNEPPHIHVDKDRASAKFWLRKVDVAYNMGYNERELNVLHKLVVKHQELFLDKWHEYFTCKN